ncbi:outer membrane beta-barrel protein [Marinobacter sediminum]|uniref:outer membrane beta-barrel protein n=1 Tax=Marinobacter sediminum TaxID=256323 RepID=UPI00193A1BA8|nr:outer membrane beta-barrel protein [Marinobacter sediminum]
MDRQQFLIFWFRQSLNVLVFLALSAGIVRAEPAVVTLGLDSRFSDNIRRAPSNEESDLESRLSIGIQHISDPDTCNSGLSARTAYRYWWDDSFDPETTADADFLGDCRLGPNVVWEVSDYLRDVAQSSRSNDTPDSRTQKNVFRTGPVVTLRMGAVDELLLSAAYENTEFREPEQKDGERHIGTVGWNHLFSPSFTAGLSASIDQSELDTGEEIDRVTYSLPFTKAWAATVLSGSFGYGQIETKLINQPTREYEAFVSNLLLVRQINASTELELESSRELTDQTADFDSRFDEFVFDLEQTSAVEVTALRLGINNDLSNGAELDIDFFASRSDYLDIGIQEDNLGVDASFRRPVTGQLTGLLGARYVWFDYSSDDTQDQIAQVNAGIEFQLNRQLNFVSSVGFERRTSDVPSREFDEAWILAGLVYQFR